MELLVNLTIKPLVWLLAIASATAVLGCVIDIIIYFPVALVIGIGFLFGGHPSQVGYLIIWLGGFVVLLVAVPLMMIFGAIIDKYGWD